MFDGFVPADIDAGEAVIRVRHGGSGPPLLLLHGIPQTHLMWHAVAPRLAERFTVVAADLRGCGASGKPPTTADHAPYTKRVMARDQVAVMRHFGFDRFAVAGHDRGGRVAYRLALDHPDRVTKLAVLDVVPTADVFARPAAEVGVDFWVWFFLAQRFDLPERVLALDPDLFVDRMLDDWSASPASFSPAVREEYRRAFRDPATRHAVCEEYRAAATLDREHDEADRGRKIRCPVLALWSKRGPLGTTFDPFAVWRTWADDVRGRGFDCGHFLPEEAPDETAAELLAFFASP